MTHENNNIGGRAEHPGSDEQKISEMLGGLKRVEAPGDFEFHLKARIAKSKPADHRRNSLIPILKYAMPLALFLVVGAGIVITNSYNSWQEPTVQIPESVEPGTSFAQVAETEDPSPASTPGEQNVAETKSQPEAPTVASNPSRTEKPGRNERPVRAVAPTRSGGGSLDITGGNSRPESVCPPGIRCSDIDIEEAFERLGIEAVLTGDIWQVKAVKADGAAGIMGVKAGDKVKELDGTPVGKNTRFKNELTVATIKVLRGGKTIGLRLNKHPQ